MSEESSRPSGIRTESEPDRARIEIHRTAGRSDWRGELAREAHRGLTSRPRELPPEYFYDARGSRLFDRITRLPEYYLTRTECAILRCISAPLVADLRPRALVEFGSGSSEKTRILLDAVQATGLLRGYGPIDVSETALVEAARRLVSEYPELEVVGVIGDFKHAITLPFGGEPRLVAFLGSTIGNMTPGNAVAFLRRVGSQLSPADGFLIGFDLVKDVDRLEAAYDDAAGVTAEFNRNMLRVVNRELEADFDVSAFRHRAIYDRVEERIEMYLVAERPQTVALRALDLTIELEAGEAIRTELSHKYTRRSATRLVERGGLRLARWETDPEELFALGLARPD